MNAHVLAIALIAVIGGAPAALGDARAGERERRPPLLATTSSTPAPRLLGTVVHSQPERSMAMVSMGGAATQTLHVGQNLGNGLRIHAIARNHIVVARGTALLTLPLWGQRTATTGKSSTRLPPGKTDSNRSDSVISATGSISAGSNAQLQAADLGDVRAACADPQLMQALPDAQKAELSASGVCNTH